MPSARSPYARPRPATRGGITTGKKSPVEDPNVRLEPTGAYGTLDIKLTINSKGDGYTDIDVEIRPKDFRLLLRGMLVQDRRRTLRMIIKEIARPPKHFRHLMGRIARAARQPALTAMLEEVGKQLKLPVTESDASAHALLLMAVDCLFRMRGKAAIIRLAK